MATEKPRITITLEPEQHAVLRRLAELQGGSMSRIVSEFLGEVTPILSQVADALELAQRASSDARAKFVRAAEEAEEELRPLAEFTRNQFDLFSAQIGRLVEEKGQTTAATHAATGPRTARAGGAGGAEGGSPRPVITGATEVQRGTGKGKGRADAATPKGASGRAK